MGCAQVTSTTIVEPASGGKKMRIRNSFRKSDLHTDSITEEFEVLSNKLS